MPVSVIVGGQFGSEGKGKIALKVAQSYRLPIAVRVGGPNSGHRVAVDGKSQVFQQLPTAATVPNATCVIAPGSYIDPELLVKEIEQTGRTPVNLIIDSKAVLITQQYRQYEREINLVDRIGSTGSGVGAAVVDRTLRSSGLAFAGEHPALKPFVRNSVPVIRSMLDCAMRVIIEGTQGFGLSLLHSSDYPYVTSRDTSAAAFVSEVGLSPLDVSEVIMVLRAFPIRVAGHSGPLPNEIDWETITAEGGHTEALVEHTTVTKQVRRVARFDPEIVRAALAVNQPTKIALNHLDYVDCNWRNVKTKVLEFTAGVETQLKREIDWLGFGPEAMISKAEYQEHPVKEEQNGNDAAPMDQ